MSFTDCSAEVPFVRDQLDKAMTCLMDAAEHIDLKAAGCDNLNMTLAKLASAFAYMSGVRERLERVQAMRGHATANDLARKRMSDPSYTPSLNEVLDDPASFLDGFREG